jgi:hypothetical protein
LQAGTYFNGERTTTQGFGPVYEDLEGKADQYF